MFSLSARRHSTLTKERRDLFIYHIQSISDIGLYLFQLHSKSQYNTFLTGSRIFFSLRDNRLFLKASVQTTQYKAL